MTVEIAYTLVEERHRLVFHHIVYALVELRHMHEVAPVRLFVDNFTQLVEQRKREDLPKYRLARVVERHLPVEQIGEAQIDRLKLRINLLYRSPCRLVAFGAGVITTNTEKFIHRGGRKTYISIGHPLEIAKCAVTCPIGKTLCVDTALLA